MADKLDDLFADLQSRGFAQDKTNADFRSYMLAPGKQGYENRKTFFEDFKSQGLTGLNSYEEFASLIGLKGRPQQPSVKPQMSAAGETAPVVQKSQPQAPTMPQLVKEGLEKGSYNSRPVPVRQAGDPGVAQFGVPYRPDTQLTAAQRDEIYRQNDFALRQMKKMQREQVRRGQPMVDTGIPSVNSSVIKTQGQWDDELQKGASRISSSVVVPAVDKAIAEFDKRAHEVFEASRGQSGGLPTGTAGGAGIFGAVRESNEAKDPDKILAYLSKQMEGLYHDKAFMQQISDEAGRMGLDSADYVENVIKPRIASDIRSRFDETMIAREMPKSGKEYVVSGLSNSIIGMLTDAFLETKGQRAYKNQAEAMTEEGRNPYYNPGTGARLTKIGVSFAADAPFFGVYGKVSGQVAKNIAEREIRNLVGKGLSETAARSVVGTALENSVGTRMKNYLMQHIVSSSLTMGGYNATSEIARQTRDKEGYDVGGILGSTAEGLAVGGAFGATGAVTQALSQPLTGFARLGAKAAGFGAEAETMYATEELTKMLHGEDAFDNPFEGSVEALEKLGVMKLSGGHLLKSAGDKIKRAREVGAMQTAEEALAGILGKTRTGVSLSDATKDYIRNTSEGSSLMESLSQMHPDRAVSEVNGKKQFTEEGEALRMQLARNYDAFMSNKDIPSTSKAELAQVFGGIYRPGLETGADIIQNEDGSVLVKTRDKDGNCIQDIKFDNLADAEQWRESHQSQCQRNDAVNMWNAASPEARQEIVDAIREQVSGEKEIAAMLERAGGMRQNRMKRELEKVNETVSKFEGRALSDEEARNYIQMVIKDGDDAVFGEIYQLIHDKAYPADVPDMARHYWEGQQLSPMDRHFALVDAQVAEERLMLQGQDYAEEVMSAADYPDEKIAELAASLSRGGITKEQFDAAVDYYNKTSKVSGMYDEAIRSVDNQVEAANAYVRQNTHTDSGSMISVTSAERPDAEYYLTAGHIEMGPDGAVRSTDGSGMVILRDKVSGEIIVTSPDQVRVDRIDDPNRIIAGNESMDGLRGQLMQQADAQIDLHPDAPEAPQEAGETFVGEDGKTYMVNPVPDENGNTVWTKVELELDENGNMTGIKGQPQELDINEYRKARSNEIDAAERPQEEMVAPVVEDDVEPVRESEPVAADNIPETPAGGEAGAEDGTGVYEPSAGVSSRIPTDEKGRKIYEQARPEDTLAELTEKYGEEKARQMIGTMAANVAAEYEKLSQKDVSKFTEMADLDAHEEALANVRTKMDYWNNLLKATEPAQELPKEEATAAEPQPAAEPPKEETPVAEMQPEEKVMEEQAMEVTEPVTESEAKTDIPVSEETQPALPTAEQKVAQGTIKQNVGKRFAFQNEDGTRSEVVIDAFKGDDQVEVTRQDYDASGAPRGEAYKQDLGMVDVGNSIINGTLQPVLSVEERLRNAYKGKPGMQNVIDVLTDEERRNMLSAVERGDQEALREMTNEYVESHREDIILNERDKRNAAVSRIMDGGGSREEKLRRVRKEYQGYDDAVIALSDEAMRPTTLEEYVSDLHSRQPKSGEGPLAYFSYDVDGNKIVGMQDESGHGTKTGGDTKGYAPWLAPKGKGMSLQRYAETVHEQLPEAVKEQYSDQDVRNAILSVFGGAERPSDITTMTLRRGILQAEQAARRMEEQWIDGPSYQKAVEGTSFAARLQRAVGDVNTEPTEGQKEAGNYKKGHMSFGGYDYTIENPAGSVRRGKDAAGREWEQKMNNTYGYILGKYGKDGDHLDMFINDGQDLDNWNGTVYVVDQVDPRTGKFDEHKVMYGFDSLDEAKRAYLSNYEEGWQGLGKIVGVTKEGFDKWLDSSKRKMKEFAEHSIAKEHMVESEHQSFAGALRQLNTRGISINDPELLKEYGLTDVTLTKTGDHVTLNKIVAETRGQGNGTRFMEDLASLADERGWTLALTPSGSFGAKSIRRLKDFYKRFGFKDNKGRNTDFSTRESMVRPPKDVLGADSPERQEQTLRDAVVDHLRQAGVEVSTDWKEGQRILDGYNRSMDVDSSAEVARLQKRINSLSKAERFIEESLKGNRQNKSFEIILPESTQRMIRREMGRDYDSHNIAANSMVHSKKNHGENGVKITENSIPLRDKDFKLAPHIMVAPDRISKGSMDPSGRESVRFEKDLSNGMVLVVEKEQKSSPDDMDTITMWAAKSSGGADARSKERPLQSTSQPANVAHEANVARADARTVISDIDAAKIKKDSERAIRNDEKISYFKTPDGHAYGYTYNGKIYVDPRIATTETPIHEYGHLWCEMKRETAPEEWNAFKNVMLNDKMVQPIIDKVKSEYPELTKEGREDDFVEEIITQFSGKRGNERLHEIAEEIAKEKGGVFGKAEAVTAMSHLKSILNRFWAGVAKMMGWKYTSASQIADRIMADMLNGVNPRSRAESIREQRIDEDKPTFFSNALYAVDHITQEKATPEQWLAMIAKNGGMKAGEDKWLGLSDWLKSHDKKSLTKQEVIDFIRQNQIQVEDVDYAEFGEANHKKMAEFNEEFRQKMFEAEKTANLTDPSDKADWAYEQMVEDYGDDFRDAFELERGLRTDDWRLTPSMGMYDEISAEAKYFLDAENAINSTRLGYTTQGLDNKKEIALVVPTIEPYNEYDDIHFGDAGGGRAIAWIRFGDTTIEAPADGLDKNKYTAKPSKNGGFDVFRPNGSEWGRIGASTAEQAIEEAYQDDITRNSSTKRVLVIDEIQSKRHQDAREKGYKDPELEKKISRMNELNSKMDAPEGISNEEYDELQQLRGEGVGRASFETSGVPAAPFEKNWHELAMKRMLRYAAENGYDKIAWTKGAQQAERYNIGEKVKWIQRGNNFGDDPNRIFIYNGQSSPNVLVDENGIITDATHALESAIGKSLGDLLGKELATKVLNSEPGEKGRIQGHDIHVGGEGMKGFYDEILPRFMNKYGKKWGVQVEEVDLPKLQPSAQKMWSIDVTPDMKASVMKGQPMFQKVEDKTLMGVHNISEEKLKKALKLGGLANPSLAVIDTQNGIHTDYGEISLIPRSTLIDAKTGRNAGTYAGDAWTPTYPDVKRSLTKKGEKHINAIAKEASGDNDDMMRHIARSIENYIEGNGDHLHFLFLQQKGLNPEIKPQRTTHSHEEFEEIQKIFGDGTSTLPSYGRTAEQDKALLDLMTRGYEEEVRNQAQMISDESKREAAVKALMKQKISSLVDDEGNLLFAPADTFVYNVWRDEKKRNNPQPDWYSTDIAADNRVAREGLSEEYAKWKDQLLADEDIEERLFAGWTKDGYRRYLKNTVQNASRLMNKESETNAYNNGGLSASKAGLVKKLKTLADIRKYRHLIKEGDDIGQELKEKESEWFDIIQQVSDMKKIDDNRFTNIDIAEARLQEAIKQRDPIRYLNSEYGYHIDKNSELASDLMNFIETASELPVKYFETKFKRPVGIEEFAIAVVPTTTSPEVVKALKDAGLEVHTYEKGATGDPHDEARTKAVMDAVRDRDDIMFQKAGDPEAEMTPEERQYWKQWDAAMRKWKERNAIPETQTGAPEKPRYQQGETALEYAERLFQWTRQNKLWQTAPKLEDYRQVREDKDLVEDAREQELRYPDSPSARMRRAAAELLRIRHAVSRQKAYDKATVKAVTDFAQDFMKLGFGDNLGRGELERVLSSVKNATGAKDIKKAVDNIMNILIDNHLRNLDQRIVKLSSVKELSKTAQGVEKQGRLELKGQRMIQAFREAREQRMTEEQIRERMAEVAEKMNRNDEEAPMWEQEYEGLAIALQYAENIEGSRSEWADLDREYKDAVKGYKTSGRSYKDQQQLLESIEQAMQENKIDRIGYFGDIIGRLEGNISESMQGAKEFVERDKERVKHIYSLVNFDLAGKESRTARREDRMDRVLKNDMLQLAFSPLATFEQMLKQFGARNVKGEGNLYNYFMRNYIDSINNAYTGTVKAREELDAKAKEIFGDKVKHWKDLYEITSKPGMDISYLDGDKEVTDKLSQGNMLYIYMANKMSDGKMKLRKMGITEEDVDAIKEALDPRLVQLGDWLQSEYLPQKRTDYNKVHERMFGAPMAAIDNYFPIKVNRDAAFQDANKYVTSEEGDKLPSAITGSIIKRTRNALPLDILHTDALSLAMEHLEEMEQWKAQAEFNRDVKDLLSNTTFRNKVKNMKTIYGSGTTLWNKFFDAATIATGDYSPKRGIADKTITNIAKGVTAAKINFRPYTAFKQLLSLPAFFHDVNTGDMAKAMLPQNYFRNNFKWAMENIPVFKKRWESRQIGDTRLMDDPSDWKIWKNKWMHVIQRGGMWANAAIDALTCAAGAKAIYDTRYKKYKDIGASDEVARKRALQDAAIGYNLTQQSNEGAFTSAIQRDRTVAANALSVFRNSSMSYTRQAFDAMRNLNKMSQKGYKEDAIDAMTHQFEHDLALDEDQARKAAEMEYAKAGRHEVAKMLNMMFGVTALWNLGASLPYLIFGDDDETRKEMLTDALIKSIAAGPVEGLAGGNIWSDLMGRALSEETRKAFREGGIGSAFESGLKQAGDYEVNPLPLMADLQSMIKKMGYDKYAAAQDLFNIAAQSYTGVNPQTITDIWNAAMDYGNPSWMPFTDSSKGNDDLANPKEIALFIMRVLNAPTSSWKNKYIDELGLNAEDAQKLPYEEMARRYAHYKHWKDAPLMGWLRSDEARQKKMESIQKQFDKAVEERMQRLTDDELMRNVARSESAEEKRRYAKMIAQRLGVTPGDDSKKATSEKDWYQNLYQQKMSYEDIREDEILADKYKNLENAFKEKREEAERKSVQDLKEFNEANKEWKDRIDEAKKEVKKRMDWIRGGKWSTPSGKKGNSKDATLQAPGKKQLETSDNPDEIMKNIRQWRKEALEMLVRAEK